MQLTSHPQQPLSLRQVLPEAELVGADDVLVSGVARDGRGARPGAVVAILASSPDEAGACVARAAAGGCAAVLAERPIEAPGVPVCYVPDVREAYGELCHALAGYPGRKIRLIGVTGAAGKTTTSHLLAAVMATGGYLPGLISTLGCFDGQEFRPPQPGVGSPEHLAACLATMVENHCTHAVLEISGTDLDEARVAGVSLDVACVTNVRRDPWDGRGSCSDYRVSKSPILGRLAGDGMAVLNADDSASAAFLCQLSLPVLTVGVRSTAEIMGSLLERCRSEQTFLLTAGSENIPVRTRIIGQQHLYNCLMAAAVGLAYGIDLTAVVRGLETVQRVPGRLERVECGQPFGVFVDCASTPDALTGCLQTLREVAEGRVICVLVTGEGSDARRPMLARAAEADADRLVLAVQGPACGDSQTALAELLEGLHRPDEAVVAADRAGAIRLAMSQARTGDCVLIAGRPECGLGRAGPDSDGELARQWLFRARPDGVSAMRP